MQHQRRRTEVGSSSISSSSSSSSPSFSAENHYESLSSQNQAKSKNEMAAKSEGSRGIDTDLYSRQIGAFGFEMMGKLMKMKVLISGLNGLGAETAKNLILAGPDSVCLHDDEAVTMRDLGANFCLTENDVHTKISRADASLRHLAQLNQYVNVYVHKGPITQEVIKSFNVVMVSDGGGRGMNVGELNEMCRSHSPPIGFILTDIFGLCGRTFVDFGNEFTCFDKNGEEPKSAIVAAITHEEEATVHVHNDKLLPFEDGDYVQFSEVQGMQEINAAPPVKIKVTGKHSFTIGDTTKYSPYTRQGIVTQVKMPVKMSFRSYREARMRPVAEGEYSLICPDFAKFGRSEQLHFITEALLSYREKHGRYHSDGDMSAYEEIEKIANELNDLCKKEGEGKEGYVSVDKIDKEILTFVAKFASCHISPMAAFFGGIAAQEIVKFTGKFSPLRQWLYFDAFECLPLEEPTDRQISGSRYDDQIAIWGKSFQQKLHALNLFVVGAGALGCEHLKNFALMGCSCDEGQAKESGGKKVGKIVVTDMDRIEISNLNRQFLFRKEHVGLPKSTTVASAVSRMNESLRVEAREVRVGAATENVFDETFWESMDVVVNALDNIQARQYVDSQCVWFMRPLLESGTLGTKGNVQVVLPRMTQSYSDSHDPPEESIPLCTLKHFPHQIEHTIEWARDLFQGIFTDAPNEAKRFVQQPENYLQKISSEGTVTVQRETLQKVYNFIENSVTVSKRTYEECVHRACKLFHEYFNNQICQLLYSFPLDHVDNSGQPFWSGPKRPPQPLNFNTEDQTTMLFVRAAANLFAFNMGLDGCDDMERIKEIARGVKFEAFQPKRIKIKIDENKEGENTAAANNEGSNTTEDDESIKEQLEKKLRDIGNLPSLQINPVVFEKDDDTNYHIEFISACANLRARNYKITECDKHKTKMIAGKIIPAIATTTAMICGLVALEVYKCVDFKQRKLEHFKNAFINLALPLWVFSEPLPPVKTVDKDYDPVACGPVRARPYGFTPWDKLTVNIPNCTISGLCDYLEKEMKVSVSILSVGDACLYNAYIPTHKKNRYDKPIAQLIEEITKHKLPANRNYVVVEASCSDLDDSVDVIIPSIKLTFK